MNEETIRRIGRRLGARLAASRSNHRCTTIRPGRPRAARSGVRYARRSAMRARPAGLRSTRQQPAGHQRGEQERDAGDPRRWLGRLGRGPMISASNKVRLGVALGWLLAAIVGAGVANADPEGGGVSEFLEELSDNGVTYTNQAAMIRVGDDACEDMRSGMSPLAVMGEIESGGGYSSQGAAFIVAAASRSLCPDTQGLISATTGRR
jgi:hypothetical protein